MGEELGADGAAGAEEDGEQEESDAGAEGRPAVLDGPGGGRAVVAGEPAEERVFPLAGALGVEEAGEDGGEDDREDESAEEGEGDGPGHGFEEATLDGLEGEDGQVGGDDDEDGVEDGALDFLGGVADLVADGLVGVLVVAEVADDVFDHDDGSVDDHAEVKGAEREEVGRDVAEVEADGGEEQRERDGDGDDERAAQVAKEEEEDDGDQDDAFHEVMEDGLGGEGEEGAAIKEGDDGDAPGEDAVVEFLDLGVDAFEGLVGVLAFLQEEDAFDDVAVIFEALAIPRADGFADLAEADLGALGHRGDV